MRYNHVYLPKEGWVILGDHVTLESGSGCVHTAGGHGVDDFNVCQKYPQVPITVPVDDGGYLTDLAGKYAGQRVWAANKTILADLTASGAVMGQLHIKHQYPHCWRCHHPIIFRATEQWFCSIAKFREDVYKAIDTVTWMPDWGHDRMKGMVRDRNDWCISRQRTWGVPIPAFYCKKCGTYHITDATIKAVSDLFRKEGSDAWYKYDANEIMPKTEVCECGASDWEKDPDIMDVWFDSGSTWSAVCRERPELNWPADLYMEGADQFRGWFQSSLLTSVATQGVAPYKGVLCHGWVVDEQGKQMHKSAGNGVEPSEIIRDYGADIVRLWVASSDYTVDVRAGKNIFKQLSEAYRKMRNTARFMLGNIGDFNPATDMVAEDQLFEIDRWALKSCNSLTANVRAAYDNYDFSRAYHAIYNFCVIDMSNFYMDVIKDRLYCADEHARRCAQTALYRILVDFTKLVAPILCFTAQEIWSYIPKLEGMQEYVCWERMPEAKSDEDAAFDAKWAKIIAVRDDVKKVLEQARADKTIGSSLEAAVTLYCSDEMYDFLNAIPMDELADLMIVSHVDLVKGEGGVRGLTEGLGMSVAHAAGNKCLRCWKFDTAVGEDGLCPRCAKVLG
ncbi:class I tRNA ligase family protein [Gemmiger sp.]|uniref:isoleucine--tRNA ligase n=1 Tax=Gemmiger sp. TaxID=2049027 RepID=UPI0031F31448